jgi:hypothetical protein
MYPRQPRAHPSPSDSRLDQTHLPLYELPEAPISKTTALKSRSCSNASRSKYFLLKQTNYDLCDRVTGAQGKQQSRDSFSSYLLNNNHHSRSRKGTTGNLTYFDLD